MNRIVPLHSKMKLFVILAGIVIINLNCNKEFDYKIAIDQSLNNKEPGTGQPITEPGIAITFDDSYYDEWIEMLPVLKKYNAKVTFFVSLDYPVKQDNCISRILELKNAGNEIGLHTLDHPHLSTYLKQHSLSEYYKNEILPEVNYLNSIGIKPVSFAYPYGEHNEEANKFLLQYFENIRGMYGYAHLKKTARVIGASLFLSGNLQDYKDQISYAKADTAIWVLVEHRPVKQITKDDTFTYSMLDSVCRFAVEQNMRFYLINEINSAGSKTR
jgi:peptidoglycan-N-acetylglucosamine deacetylase